MASSHHMEPKKCSPLKEKKKVKRQPLRQMSPTALPTVVNERSWKGETRCCFFITYKEPEICVDFPKMWMNVTGHQFAAEDHWQTTAVTWDLITCLVVRGDPPRVSNVSKFTLGHKVLMTSFCFQFLGNAPTTQCSVKRIVSSTTTLAIMAAIATNVTDIFQVGTASTGRQAHKCRSFVSQHTVVAHMLLVGWTDTTLQWRKVLSVGKSAFTGLAFVVGKIPKLLWETALDSMSTGLIPHQTVIIATVEVKGTVSNWTSTSLRRHSRAIVVLKVTLFWQKKWQHGGCETKECLFLNRKLATFATSASQIPANKGWSTRRKETELPWIQISVRWPDTIRFLFYSLFGVQRCPNENQAVTCLQL